MAIKEVVDALDEWLEAMPPNLRKTPMVGVIGIVGRALTPEELVDEVKRQTEVGRSLERAVIQLGVDFLRG